ncbi:MAG: tRNA epoxyqueuosine(34) reductase QueG [Planctomycetota bacterium]
MLEGAELLAAARRLGEAEGLVGGEAAPLAGLDDAERQRAWLEAGYAGEMDYLPKYEALRSRPAEGFAPHVSVISFLLPHETRAPDPSPRIGNVARYARGDDYHDVIRAKLERVGRGLAELDPELRWRACVDTAPFPEKFAAARAGLGWAGKHTNVIRSDAGSFFFLAELLVDRALPTGEPAKDRCGRCTACLDACPTGAIVAPYVLDARRCISYLTIELRGAIPRELRPLVGHRIFGCDDCQEVCPWNRFATREPPAELRARPGVTDRDLVDWLDLDVEGWRALFRRSAVKRAKYAGFKRNVAVALGCLADPATIPAIAAAYDREEPLVREHLAWAMGRIPGAEASAHLRSWAGREPDAAVRAEIALSRAERGEDRD